MIESLFIVAEKKEVSSAKKKMEQLPFAFCFDSLLSFFLLQRTLMVHSERSYVWLCFDAKGNVAVGKFNGNEICCCCRRRSTELIPTNRQAENRVDPCIDFVALGRRIVQPNWLRLLLFIWEKNWISMIVIEFRLIFAEFATNKMLSNILKC